MSTSLTRIMVVSISLCWLLSAKTHLNDIVDPSVAEKLAAEALLQQEVDNTTTAPTEEKKTINNNINKNVASTLDKLNISYDKSISTHLRYNIVFNIKYY